MTVAEVAHLFNVDRDTVKKWGFHFSEYLSKEANPPRGSARLFSKDDLRVFSYVLMYWEDEPDFENIKFGLNSGSHFEEPYNTFIRQNTLIFQEPPEGLDETWRHGAIFGGIVEGGDSFHLAESYKRAGDILIDGALATEDVYELICPIVYNYRHAAELYLKAVTDDRLKSHNLGALLTKFKDQMTSEFNEPPPKWFVDIVSGFDDFDPSSTTFRYGNGALTDEVWIDLHLLKSKMGMFEGAMQRIRQAQWED